MSDFTNEYIKYRLERAKGALEVARLSAKVEEYNSCANRLYYAVFYAVNALLMKHGFASSKHSGVRGIFNKEFIRTKIVPKKYGLLFNDLFDSRQECDYKDLFFIPAAEIKPLIPQVSEFIEFVKNLVEDK